MYRMLLFLCTILWYYCSFCFLVIVVFLYVFSLCIFLYVCFPSMSFCLFVVYFLFVFTYFAYYLFHNLHT